jgi:hypothetical protein
VRCRLPCQIVESRRRSLDAAVVTLSEGGLAVETALSVEQGEPIHLRILANRGARAVEVDGIVWNDHAAGRARGASRLRVLGCVVSDPPAAFLELLDEVERQKASPERRPLPARPRSTAAVPEPQPAAAPAPAPRACAAPAREPEPDLPRSRAPLAPPKPEAEEALPGFRVRFKQVGGPRTRVLTVRARSFAQAEERARTELAACAAADACVWHLLEILPGAGG